MNKSAGTHSRRGRRRHCGRGGHAPAGMTASCPSTSQTLRSQSTQFALWSRAGHSKASPDVSPALFRVRIELLVGTGGTPRHERARSPRIWDAPELELRSGGNGCASMIGNGADFQILCSYCRERELLIGSFEQLHVSSTERPRDSKRPVGDSLPASNSKSRK